MALPIAGELADPDEPLEQRFVRGLEQWRVSPAARRLPWYLVLGESGSGKTSLLAASGLEVPAHTALLSPAPELQLAHGPTREIAWWAANEGVWIDTPGRILDSDRPEVRSEWVRLLRAIRRHGARVPLHGIVVALALPRLLGATRAELEDAAQRLRRRLHDALVELRTDLPVYLLITQIDRLDGLLDALGSCPPERAHEALGWTNGERVLGDPEGALERGLAPLIERFERLLPGLLLRESEPRRRRALFQLPEALGDVARAAGVFASHAFGRSVYGPAPFLRGVYLGSAQREGAARRSAARGVAPASAETGLFLRDLFLRIVSDDEETALASPRRELAPRVRRTAVIGAWLAGAIAASLVAISGAAERRGVQRLAAAQSSLAPRPVQLAALASAGGRADAVIAERTGRPLPLSLRGPRHAAAQRLREQVRGEFVSSQLQPMDRRIARALERGESDALAALIALALDARWLGAPAGEPPPRQLEAFLGCDRGGCSPSERASFRSLYRGYVRWSADDALQARRGQELALLRRHAPRLLDTAGLERWCAGASERCAPVRSGDDARCAVPGLYTRQGWEEIVAPLLDAVARAGDPAGGDLARFGDRYRAAYQRQWGSFVLCASARLAREAAVSPVHAALVESLSLHTAAGSLWRGQAAPGWFASVQDLVPGSERRARDGYRALVQRIGQQLQRAADPALTGPADATGLAARGLGLVQERIPPQGSAQERRIRMQLRAIFEHPFTTARRVLSGRSRDRLEAEWRARIAVPYADRLDAARLRELLEPGTGALALFERDVLAPLVRDGRPLPGAEAELGEDFRTWMAHASRLRLILFGDARTLRVHGAPPRVDGGADLFVTRQRLELRCPDRVESFEYEGGSRAGALRWSPGCSDVTLRVFVRSLGSPERELEPAREWKGPYGLGDFLAEGVPDGEHGLRWSLARAPQALAIGIRFSFQEAGWLGDLRERTPPSSLRP